MPPYDDDDDGAGEAAPGPTAAQLDVWGRLAWLAGLVLVVAAALAFGSSTGAGLAVGGAALVFVVLAIILGLRSSRAARQEKALGYSTLFDFPGFALRHSRSKELLRAADEEPLAPGRRSVFRAMLSVKPGTVLARQFEAEDRAAAAERKARRIKPE
jgi:hypothetical protein